MITEFTKAIKNYLEALLSRFSTLVKRLTDTTVTLESIRVTSQTK